MNKDFWERIDRLEELAGKATSYIEENIMLIRDVEGHWAVECPIRDDLEFHAAANPAMIMEMIAVFKGRLSFLEHELVEKDIELENTKAELKKLEKEADCLATFLADICDYVADTDCCPVAEASVCPCDKCKDANKPEIWREKARELVELRIEADNA